MVSDVPVEPDTAMRRPDAPGVAGYRKAASAVVKLTPCTVTYVPSTMLAGTDVNTGAVDATVAS